MELTSLPLVSADSHVEEPSYLWTRHLPASMVKELPIALQQGADTASTFAKRIGVGETEEVKGLTDAARLAGADDVEALCELTADPDRRLAVMRQDDIAAECIYPTSGLFVWSLDNPRVGEACCRLYNEWVYDRLESRSPRFRCAGMIPTWNVEKAIAEVQHIADMGLAAALMPLVGKPEYNHRDWQPLWSAIEETGLPVVMHQGTGHDMLFYRGPGAAVSNLVATQSMAPRTAVLLSTSSVLAAHPGLHFIFVETNASWLPWAMSTADFYHESFQEYDGWVWPDLPEKPSFYMTRQIHGTFQYDPFVVDSLSRTGVEPVLWGSDFPHAEGTFPHSRDSVTEQLAGVEIASAAAIAGGTAAKLFRFDPEVLTKPF
ncbi:MAG: amidohydrolase family protein [bacterium]|nr:hypothetical protein [Deltaproteobacteria bacterium]MCP4906212.1 amidohydrolase family protein [bacterium]